MADTKKSVKPTRTAPAARTRPIPKAAAAVTQPVRTPSPARAPVVAPQSASPAARPPPLAPSRADKPKKTKLVRDSFKIPKAEFTVLEELKQRAAGAGRPVKKSELLRAGIKALAALPDAAFLAALQAVPAIKSGRLAKS